ncbi:MAG: TonB-dependent receptor [Sphingorhabdus sp.]|uniref:TonB-dependent receptor n=1 Tax=Sphingorhabdus sp. TaxID=1902408 RepID=UPI00273EA2FA|nr:TonB-dependent receptor [Sphingorhabdus sp.]MDP4757928.1 TonB-dependent receptor [Sphingorhabdus sp.]MDP4927069.1 TonB-dependent receptor [Sphingorhabdus sp.]
MRRFNRLITAALCSTICSAMLVPAAYAQTAESSDDSGDEPIIVTATLRAMDVQDIPLAVTAVAPEALERQGVNDIKNLASISPSINIQSSQTETQGTSIKIRGVGTTGNNTGLESSVGVFIDGVYQSRPGVALGDLVDIERLEILRGPQGTLFGRNTSAGALNVSTKRPSLSTTEGFVNASYGNYDFMNLQGGVSLPVVQDVAGVRLSGTWRKRDGYLKSPTGAESNDRDRYMLRGQLYIEPNADVSIRLLADYAKTDEQCCEAVIVRETELAPFSAFHGLASDGVDQSGLSALKNLSINGGPYKNGSKQWGTSAELKWDLGGAKLTSVTAYRKFDSSSTTVGGFTANDTYTVGNGAPTSRVGILPSGDHIKTFTQELRLQGTAVNDHVDWLVGGFYSSEKIRADQTMTLNADFQKTGSAFNFANAAGVNPLFALTALGNAGVPVNANGNYAENRFLQDASSYSVFTHNVISFTDKLSLTLGARYVNETKDASFNQLAGTTGAGASACQASVNGVLTGGVPAPLRAGMIGINCFPFATSVALTAPAAVGGGLASAKLPLPRVWAQEFKDDEITYTAQLGYKANEDLLLYAGYSHGFKSGGFNLDPQSATLQNSGAILAGLATGTIVAPVYADPSFKSEKVNQIEVGVKATLFGAIKANLALFDMKMSDFQVLEFTGVQFLTFNVNSARSTGAELELFGKLSDNISANVSATYANARYPSNCADGVAVAARPSTLRLCGQDLTNAPRFAGVVGMTYNGPLNDSGWNLLVNGNVNYSDSRTTRTIDTDTNGLPVPLAQQENYFKMNARIGLTTPDDRYTFELWGTNLTNEITRGITANTPLRGGAGTRSLIGFVEEPRMYGMTVRAKF